MQEGWERRHPRVELTTNEIAAMLRPAAPDRDVAHAEPLSGGLANSVYKVLLTDGQPVVLRVFTRDASACRREIALYVLVHESVPVPELLYADCKGRVTGQPYAVTRWVEGTKLDELLAQGSMRDIGAAAVGVGETLASIGRFAFARAGFFGPDLDVVEPLGSMREACFGYVEEALFRRGGAAHLGEDFARQIWAFLREHAALLDAVDEDPQLVHGDYKAQNLLMRRGASEWEVAAVLDWEFALASTPLLDLAILLRYAERLPRAFEDGVIASYLGAGGALPRDWKHLIKLLDLMNLCDFAARGEPGGAMLDDVARLLCATLDQWASAAT
jgi:aminoglycoside phosphotransferase (APT) family kinase protein